MAWCLISYAEANIYPWNYSFRCYTAEGCVVTFIVLSLKICVQSAIPLSFPAYCKSVYVMWKINRTEFRKVVCIYVYRTCNNILKFRREMFSVAAMYR
jgi:hypothetical protein